MVTVHLNKTLKIVTMEFLQEVHCMLFLTLEDDDAGMPLPTVNSYQELSELLTNTSQSMGESTDSDSSDDSSATKKTYTGEGSSLATQILLYFKVSSFFTARQRSCGKVMFSVVSVPQSVHKGRRGLPHVFTHRL